MESLPVEIFGYIVDFAGPSSRFALAQVSTELTKCAKKVNAHDLCADAINTGSVDFVGWIISFGYKWTTALSKCAINGNHVAIVKYTIDMYRTSYMIESYYGRSTYTKTPIGEIWVGAVDRDSVEMINIAIDNSVILANSCCYRAAFMGSIGILEMLHKRYKIPPNDLYEYGVRGKNIATIKWIHSYGVLPQMNYRNVVQLISYRCYEIINWLMQMELLVANQTDRNNIHLLIYMEGGYLSSSYFREREWTYLAQFVDEYGKL